MNLSEKVLLFMAEGRPFQLSTDLQIQKWVEDDFPAWRAEAYQALMAYASGMVSGGSNIFNRYDWTLTKVQRGYYSGLDFTFKFAPKGKHRSLAGREIPYKDLRSVPDHAYRGMSWEEWKLALRRGYVLSKGTYNFSSQEGLTFFSPDIKTAMSYAGSFASVQYKPSRAKPGVIIEVSSIDMLDGEEGSEYEEEIPRGELATEGPVDLDRITKAWYVVPGDTSGPGHVELYWDIAHKKVKEGSRMFPSTDWLVIHIDLSRSSPEKGEPRYDL